MAIGKVHYSFRPGFDTLKSSDVPAVKAELKEVMGKNSILSSIESERIIQIFPLF